jgi:hypothetical protein
MCFLENKCYAVQAHSLKMLKNNVLHPIGHVLAFKYISHVDGILTIFLTAGGEACKRTDGYNQSEAQRYAYVHSYAYISLVCM